MDITGRSFAQVVVAEREAPGEGPGVGGTKEPSKGSKKNWEKCGCKPKEQGFKIAIDT